MSSWCKAEEEEGVLHLLLEEAPLISLFGFGRELTISEAERNLVCLKGAGFDQWNHQVKYFELYPYPLFTLKERENRCPRENLAFNSSLPSNNANLMLSFEIT